MLAPPVLAGTPPGSSLAEDLARFEIDNGCFVKSAAFLQRYLATNPGECGEMLVLDLKEENSGHALAMFGVNGQVWAYDHELGVFPTGIKASGYSANRAREHVGKLYAERIAWAKEDIRAGRRSATAGASGTALGQARAARDALGQGIDSRMLQINQGDGYAVVFGHGDSLWVYVPTVGTGRARIRAGVSLAETVRMVLGEMGVSCRDLQPGA